MLNYTFSTREKVMIAVLAFVAVGLVWYKFIFVGTADQISSLDSQIQQAQDEQVTYQAQAQALKSIKEDLKELQDSGQEPKTMPDYDNTQKLMAFLNGVVGGANGYSISFDDPELGEDNLVHRSGMIQFGSGSYEEARTMVLAIAEGPYPCEVTDLSMSDKAASTTSGRTTSGASYEASMAVTFFENPTEDMVAKSGDDIPEGNDWTVYQDL